MEHYFFSNSKMFFLVNMVFSLSSMFGYGRWLFLGSPCFCFYFRLIVYIIVSSRTWSSWVSLKAIESSYYLYGNPVIPVRIIIERFRILVKIFRKIGALTMCIENGKIHPDRMLSGKRNSRKSLCDLYIITSTRLCPRGQLCRPKMAESSNGTMPSRLWRFILVAMVKKLPTTQR